MEFIKKVRIFIPVVLLILTACAESPEPNIFTPATTERLNETAVYYSSESIDLGTNEHSSKKTFRVGSISLVEIAYTANGKPYLRVKLTAADPGVALSFSTSYALYRVENDQEILVGDFGLDNSISTRTPEGENTYASITDRVSFSLICLGSSVTQLSPGNYRLYYRGYDSEGVYVDFTVTETIRWN